MKTISIVTACFNEEANVEELYLRIRAVMTTIGRYRYEHIFIDNHSQDNTVAVLKRIAAQDTNVRIIVNARNFGHIRSPIHGIFQARGDAVIFLVSDLQDPPEMIANFIQYWEQGNKMVLAVKQSSEEHSLMFWLRKSYYRMVERMATVNTFENVTGFGLYDRQVVDIIKSFRDPYPYFRGMIAEIALPHKMIPYTQPRRKRGISKNNFYTLYDIAMLGFVNLSKVPLRMATFLGFVSAATCLLLALFYLVYKLLYWHNFSVGMAPLIIGVFLFCSLQLIAMGILGEYVGAIYTHIQARPYVVELERINFEHEPELPKPDTKPD